MPLPQTSIAFGSRLCASTPSAADSSGSAWTTHGNSRLNPTATSVSSRTRSWTAELDMRRVSVRTDDDIVVDFSTGQAHDLPHHRCTHRVRPTPNGVGAASQGELTSGEAGRHRIRQGLGCSQFANRTLPHGPKRGGTRRTGQYEKPSSDGISRHSPAPADTPLAHLNSWWRVGRDCVGVSALVGSTRSWSTRGCWMERRAWLAVVGEGRSRVKYSFSTMSARRGGADRLTSSAHLTSAVMESHRSVRKPLPVPRRGPLKPGSAGPGYRGGRQPSP
jgi:hypothetical protein